jgi:hypothetical protein
MVDLSTGHNGKENDGCENPLRADAVEKGKNEPTEIFARASVETGFS